MKVGADCGLQSRDTCLGLIIFALDIVLELFYTNVTVSIATVDES